MESAKKRVNRYMKLGRIEVLSTEVLLYPWWKRFKAEGRGVRDTSTFTAGVGIPRGKKKSNKQTVLLNTAVL